MTPKSEAEAVVQYKPFVLKTAKRFAASGVPYEDLIQEGLMAVVLALRTWREDGGANFLTWIRRPVYYAMLRLARAQKRAGGSLRGGSSGDSRVKSGVRLVSLDSEGQDGKGNRSFSSSEEHVSLHEAVGTFEEPADPFARSLLPDMVSGLSVRERQVIRLRFERGLSHEEAGKRMGVSRELARQIEKKAMSRLKDLMANTKDTES